MKQKTMCVSLELSRRIVRTKKKMSVLFIVTYLDRPIPNFFTKSRLAGKINRRYLDLFRKENFLRYSKISHLCNIRVQIQMKILLSCFI